MSRERQLVTVMFVDLGGFKVPSTVRTGEGRNDHLANLSHQVGAVINAHGGIIERRPGNTLLALFGTDPAREDHPARAVRAALELQTRLTEFQPAGAPPTSRIRIGIHTEAVAQPVGTPSPGWASAEAINLARALHNSAPAGTVLISQETCREVYSLFDVQGLPPLTVAGRREPVQSYLVLRVRPRSLARTLRGLEAVETEMIGRGPELESLKSTFCEVLERQELRRVTILGEAGIGKSRLLHEFQKWVQLIPTQARLFYGRAEAGMAGRPFALLRDVFCSRFEIQESDPPNIAREKFIRGFADLVGEPDDRSMGEEDLTVQIRVLGHLLGFDFPDEPGRGDLRGDLNQARHPAFQILSRFFAATSKTALDPGKPSARVVLLVLENVHWSDDDSLELVANLAQTCRQSPLMILSLARPVLLERLPAWNDEAGHLRLELEPLSQEESALMLQTVLRDSSQLQPDLCDLVLANTGGIPLYIEEFTTMLLEDSAGTSARPTSDVKHALAMRVPPTLTGVLQARLGGLPGLERAVLQCASVIGHVFWDSAVERLMGHVNLALQPPAPRTDLKPDILAALADLCGKRLLYQRESSGFGGTVEYTFKHELLRDTAYESLPKPARRACHAQVSAWLIQNSAERIKEFAGLVAVHFEQAGQFAAAAEWYGRAGQQARATYAPAAAIDYFQKALKLQPTDLAQTETSQASRMEWHEGLSAALTQQARFEEAQKTFGQLRSLAEAAGNLALQARAWNGLAYLHERRGDNHASIVATEPAEKLAHLAGETCRGELIHALQLRAWASYRMGDAPKVLALAGQTLKLCEASGDQTGMATSFKLYGVAHLQLGRYSEADRAFQQGLKLCSDAGDRRNAAAMLSNLGESARLRGDCLLAVELYQKALDIARDIGERPSEMIYLSNLAGARLGLGQHQEAEADLRQAIALTGMPKSCVLSETFYLLGIACLRQGKLSDALSAAQRAVAIGQESENHLDLAGSWRVLGQVVATILQADSPTPMTSIEFAEPLPEPAYCFAESQRIYEKIGAEDERARTLQAWAEFDQQQGRLEASRRRSEEVRKILERLAKPPASLASSTVG